MARAGIVGLCFAAAAFVLAAATIPAAARDISVTFGQGTGLTECEAAPVNSSCRPTAELTLQFGQ
jgi:hypothetical protein